MQENFSLYFSYLPKLEYAQWVNTLTPGPNFPGLNPTNEQVWTLGTNLISRLSSLIDQHEVMINIT